MPARSSPTRPSRRDAIAGVTLTTQRGTVVVTDDGRATRSARPSSGWTDAGGRGLRRRVGGGHGPRLPGDSACATPSQGSPPTARRTGSARTSRTRGGRSATTCGLSGFLTHRLTGRWVDSTAAQVGYLPFDYKALPLGGARRLEMDRRAVEPAWLPELVAADRSRSASSTRPRPPRTRACRPACRSSPRPRTRPARSSAPGPSRRTSLGLSYGTAATVNVTSDRYVEPIPLIPPFPAAIPGAGTSRCRSTAATGWSSGSSASSATARSPRRTTRGIAPEVLFDELVAGGAGRGRTG